MAVERRLLRVPNARFDFALAIGIADATRERDDTVMRQQITIEGIERRVVDVRGEHALFEVIEDDDFRRAAKSSKRALVQFAPDLRARAPRQQPHRFARARQREDEEARASILAGLGPPDHRPVAIIDLAFFTGRRGDHDPRLVDDRPTELRDEPLHAGVPGGQAVIVHEVLIDRHRVAAAADRLDNQLAIGLTGAGPRAPTR